MRTCTPTSGCGCCRPSCSQPTAGPGASAAGCRRDHHLRDLRGDPPGPGPLRPRGVRVLHHLDDPAAPTTSWPPRCWPGRPAWSTSTPVSPASASCRCSRPWTSCARPATCSTTLLDDAAVPRAGAPARGRARRSCSATRTPTRTPGSRPPSGRSTWPSAGCATCAPRARCPPAAVPRPRRHRRSGRRAHLRGDPGPAQGGARRRDQGDRAGRGDLRQVPAARAGPGEPRARCWPRCSRAPCCTATPCRHRQL